MNASATTLTQQNWDVAAEAARLQSLMQAMLQEAQQQGASAAEAGVSRDNGLSVQVRDGEVETVEFNRDGGFGITVYFGQQKGSASTTDTSPAALKATVHAACEIAKRTTADPFAGLADANLMARDLPDLDLDHPWDLSPEDAIALALRCERAGLHALPSVKKTDNVSFNSHRGVRCYGNSNGFIAAFPSTRHSLSASMIAENEHGMQRDYWYTVARDHNDLLSPETVGQTAAERAAKRLGAQPLATGTYPILMVPEVARGLWGHLLSALKGGAQYRGATFLRDTMGVAVLPNWLSVIEKPRVKKALGSSNFDDDGVATYEHDIVRDGVVKNYILSAYSARRLGLQTTANAGGVHNVEIDARHPRHRYEQLLKQLHNGIVVTSLMGQGVNLVNGDYSRGASGFLVRNGEIIHPVEEITIAGNLNQMLNNIVAIGSDIDEQSSLWTGSVLLSEMTVASQQE